MFAVIKTGGKQYKVAENDEIVVEKLAGESGDQIVFEDVLMLGRDAGVDVGAPFVAGASVVGEVAEQRKGEKVLIFKKRQRSTYRRKNGHRQLETVVKITSILADGAKPAAKKKAAPKPKKVDETAQEAKAAEAPAKAKAPEAKPAEKAAPKAEPAAAADDLTKMKGLGKVMAEKLTGAGVTTFAQIAAMDEAAIADLEDKIGAAGKFAKNEWVAQAKDLAENS